MSRAHAAEVTLERLAGWLAEPEGERLEFKRAENQYKFENLLRYCCAIANEGGGHLILGVTDARPREVKGTRAFENREKTILDVLTKLRMRIGMTELNHPQGRVVVVSIPRRPLGQPIELDGAFLMRAGESVVAMTSDQLRRIFDEVMIDISADVVPGARLDDLDVESIALFKRQWAERSRRPERAEMDAATLLEDAEFLQDGRVTLAALILLGTPAALGRHVPQSEVIFEYRTAEGEIPYADRQTFRRGFLGFHDRLWELVRARNTVHTVQDGLFRIETPTFNESAVREAILNGLCHRDYRDGGSIFIRQWPARLEVTSPGGFPDGITAENLLTRQKPRNRRLAEALEKCGLVERSGQGADRMFTSALREGKAPPSYAGTDAHQVVVTLDGQVRDERFLRFLARLGAEDQRPLSVQDLLVMNAVASEKAIPENVRDRVEGLLARGVLERQARGRFLLSQRYYEFAGDTAEYSRRRGLDRDTLKELLLAHLGRVDNGAPISELHEVLPQLSRDALRVLLRELQGAGRIYLQGEKRASRWYRTSGR